MSKSLVILSFCVVVVAKEKITVLLERKKGVGGGGGKTLSKVGEGACVSNS